MPDVLLEQVGAAGRAVLEQAQRVMRAHVLADHDHADVRMRLVQCRCSLDALVRVRRRHADVGDDDVRLVLLHCVQERGQVTAVLRDLDLVLALEDLPNPLTDQIRVLGDDDGVRPFVFVHRWFTPSRPFSGIRPSTVVPPPETERIAIEPPTAPMRSVMFVWPPPPRRCRIEKPAPASVTRKWSVRPSRRSTTRALTTSPPCLTTFCSASRHV